MTKTKTVGLKSSNYFPLGKMKKEYLLSLYEYIKHNDYSGYDIFDGLNAKLPKYLGLYNSPLFRLFWIQLNKNLPINLRPLFLTPKGFNPKGGALFILGLVDLYLSEKDPQYLEDIKYLLTKIFFVRIKTAYGSAWGYNFEWQARAFRVPEGTPNIVTTVYIAKALLLCQEKLGMDFSGTLKGIKEFILKEMVNFETNDEMCFNYIPREDAQVHNANLLAASFLAEYYSLYKEDALIKKIEKSVKFSIKAIRANFSWPYGTKPFHSWVDNFHTAFNIESLIIIDSILPHLGLKNIIERTTAYYFDKLFDYDGTAKYYSNKKYPIDIHVLCEVKILLNKLKDLSEKYKINKNKTRALEIKNNEWLEKFRSPRGYFYSQCKDFFWNKISYIRWGQAWAFYALSTDLPFSKEEENKNG
ncbi:hypothetical protein OMAG_000733 [Candidatus Omnitrophus magneticus]|uniref:Delta-aminolevulinic acid dehydratase n=1 Tax=Candidatus Omnitrophus magneticus TaxID=1609969 RepID=A0A0F0CQ06_9BACT|nr:hypothetical protein OMAG_000733 [Candidatus Omnitrophus magneticus]